MQRPALCGFVSWNQVCKKCVLMLWMLDLAGLTDPAAARRVGSGGGGSNGGNGSNGNGG